MRYLMLVLICTVTLAVSVVAYLASNEWFGAGDWTSYAVFSTPFVLLVAAAIGVMRSQINSRVLASLVGIMLGGLVGYGWTIVVWSFLGPWFGAFSFPVGLFWIAGGAVTGLGSGLLPGKTVGETELPEDSS